MLHEGIAPLDRHSFASADRDALSEQDIGSGILFGVKTTSSNLRLRSKNDLTSFEDIEQHHSIFHSIHSTI
jgi:hypothetical protein